jgi:hypothetical protein
MEEWKEGRGGRKQETVPTEGHAPTTKEKREGEAHGEGLVVYWRGSIVRKFEKTVPGRVD